MVFHGLLPTWLLIVTVGIVIAVKRFRRPQSHSTEWRGVKRFTVIAVPSVPLSLKNWIPPENHFLEVGLKKWQWDCREVYFGDGGLKGIKDILKLCMIFLSSTNLSQMPPTPKRSCHTVYQYTGIADTAWSQKYSFSFLNNIWYTAEMYVFFKIGHGPYNTNIRS